MIGAKFYLRVASALLCVLTLQNCASRPIAPVEVATPPPSVDLRYAAAPITQPLNVSILLFDASIEGESIDRIYQPIRNAEAAYLPVILRNTLSESGYWGAVSVVPSLDTASEVFVTGAIVESNALELAIKFRVFDSRGVLWLDRVYRDFVLAEAYDEDVTLAEDPFQDLYDQLANDMSQVQSDLSARDTASILDTAMLRYAVLLSPSAFSSYLSQADDGTLDLQGLPARNDPLYRRVREIRQREFAIQDVVGDHFENFYVDMQSVYPYWRQSSFELLAYNSQLAARTSLSQRGSWAEVERVYRLYKERKLNEDELRELASSFEREIDPTVAELEGRVIELQGSLLTQYQTWRSILQQIYEETVGQTPLKVVRPNPPVPEQLPVQN